MGRIRVWVAAVLLLMSGAVCGQSLEVLGFRELNNDLDARVNFPKIDQNGKKCAILKVVGSESLSHLERGFRFEVGSMGIIEIVKKTGEYWVYVATPIRKVSVFHDSYGPVRDHELGLPVKEATCYELKLGLKGGTKPEEVMQYVVFRVDAPSAAVKINGKTIEVKNGVASTKLQKGKYEYEVSALRYEDYKGTVVVDGVQDKQEVALNMVPIFKKVTLSAAEGVQIWVDGELKGTGSWTGDMEFSTYSIECRKTGHRPSSQVIAILREGQSDFNLTAPVPMYGSIEVEVEPIDAEVFLDGVKMGTTPKRLGKVLAGKHQIKVSKAGHEDMVKEVTVEENAVYTVDGALKEATKAVVQTGSQNVDSKTFTVKGVSFTMVQVSGGTFQMGATSEQGSNADDDESPIHNVTLSNYMIGETEVTQALWKAVMGNNPSNWKGDNLPVESVSWKDCQTFIKKLNSLTGQNFRLPTEAEWEYAARGGNKSNNTKYSGSSNIDNVAWYYDNSGRTTHVVKGKQPNELGLYDMSGNVWEWCQDWYGIYSSSSQTAPKGASSGSFRVNRGGSWYRNAGRCRVSNRSCTTPDFRLNRLGLRLAL